MFEEDHEALVRHNVRLHFLARPVLQELSSLDLSGCLSFSDASTVVAGGFADVIRGYYMCRRRGVVAVAIKRLRFYMKEDIKKLFEKEIYVWSKLKHTNVLPLLGYDFDNVTGYPLLVSEWMDNGPVLTYVKRHPHADVYALVTGTARGLAYLHEKLVVHSDIKSDNILVSAGGEALICDFGGARIMAASRSMANPSSSNKGTYCYLARELLADTSESARHTFATDVWAFGMTVFELLTLERPYSKLSEFQVLLAIQRGELPRFPVAWPHNIVPTLAHGLETICRACWTFDPLGRPSMHDILRTLELGTAPEQFSVFSPEGLINQGIGSLPWLPVNVFYSPAPLEPVTSTAMIPRPELNSFAQLSSDIPQSRWPVAESHEPFNLLPPIGQFSSNFSHERSRRLVGQFERISVDVIVRILTFLDYRALFAVSRLNHFFRNIFVDSPELQYAFVLQVYGMIDVDASLDVRSKLRELERQERAWRSMDLSRGVMVSIPHRRLHLYDLSGGVFVLDGDKRAQKPYDIRSLKFLDLAPCASGSNHPFETWSHVNIDSNIVDFALSLNESDLVAVVGRTPGQLSGLEYIVLSIRQLSSGAPHPLARNPDIIVNMVSSDQGSLSIALEIVGPRLLMLLSWGQISQEFHRAPPDELILYNWWYGTRIASEHTSGLTWSGFVFLSPDFILLACYDGGLEVIRLPDATCGYSPSGFERVLRLSLPTLQPSVTISTAQSRAEPNPFGAPHPSMSKGKQQIELAQRVHTKCPFAPDPMKALVLLQIVLYIGPLDLPISEDDGQLDGHRTYLVVHRESLLQLVDAFANAQLSSVTTSCSGARVNDGTFEAPTISWAQWGSNTRWMVDNSRMHTYITVNAGQRCVGRNKEGHIVVRDFNPISVRRARLAAATAVQGRASYRSGVDDAGSIADFGDPTWRSVRIVEDYDETESTLLQCFFAEPCGGPLEYVEYRSQQRYECDDILMDEERIIGLHDDVSGRLYRMDVFTL